MADDAERTDPRHRPDASKAVPAISLAGGATSAGAILYLLIQMQTQVGSIGQQLAVVVSQVTTVQATQAADAARAEMWREQMASTIHALDTRTTILEQRSTTPPARR